MPKRKVSKKPTAAKQELQSHGQSTTDGSSDEVQETPKSTNNGAKSKKLLLESPTDNVLDLSGLASNDGSSDEKENKSPQITVKKAASSNAKSKLRNAGAAKTTAKAKKTPEIEVSEEDDSPDEEEKGSDQEEEEQRPPSPPKKITRNAKKADAPPKQTVEALSEEDSGSASDDGSPDEMENNSPVQTTVKKAASSNATSKLRNVGAAKTTAKAKKTTEIEEEVSEEDDSPNEEEKGSDEEEEEQRPVSPLKKITRNAKKANAPSKQTVEALSEEHSGSVSDDGSSDEMENKSPMQTSKKPTNVAAKKGNSAANKPPVMNKQKKTEPKPAERDMPRLDSDNEEKDVQNVASSHAKSKSRKAGAAKTAAKPKKTTNMKEEVSEEDDNLDEEEKGSDVEEEKQRPVSPLKKMNRNVKKADAPSKQTVETLADGLKKVTIVGKEDGKDGKKTVKKEERKPKGASLKTKDKATRKPKAVKEATKSTKSKKDDSSQANSNGPVFNSNATIADKTRAVVFFLLQRNKKTTIQAAKMYLKELGINITANAVRIKDTVRKMFDDREVVHADGTNFSTMSKSFKRMPVKQRVIAKPIEEQKVNAVSTVTTRAPSGYVRGPGGHDRKKSARIFAPSIGRVVSGKPTDKKEMKKKKKKVKDESDLEQFSDDEDVPPHAR